MTEMTAVDAIALIEDRLQHVNASLPAHIQIKQAIETVRQEEKRRRKPETESKDARGKKTKP